ncbi:hypothetical protein Tfer_0367 [Thermincola ferriacetica]|uniref:Uncharacterized protein n=1 Tax=Thermincola ferriacetica TaxID=281456 RepID=A0A0L6W6F1_9FIRM|nr:hypothetical protein Tfer_0367 [Thermincola ferriacetica]
MILAVFVIVILCILALGIADMSLFEIRANKAENRQFVDEEKARAVYYLVLWDIKTGEISPEDFETKDVDERYYDLGQDLGRVKVSIDYVDRDEDHHRHHNNSHDNGHHFGHYNHDHDHDDGKGNPHDYYYLEIYPDPVDTSVVWAAEVRTKKNWDKLEIFDDLHRNI